MGPGVREIAGNPHRGPSNNNTVADLVSANNATILVRIYITPPFQMNVNTCSVNVTTKHVAFFTTTNTFLVYEVDL